MAKKLVAVRKRRNPNGIPVEETNLTPEERALLPDPAIVTEDDADFITAYRRRNDKHYPLDSVLKEYGFKRRVDR